ncbi:MAG: class IV adenylate cyclase [Candidatus Hodarchaeota archaeon]
MPILMVHVNIEFKAKCSNPEHIRKILKSRNAEFKGTDHQIDSYFKVHSGRLKLREGNIETALIYYERKDKEGPKQSNVTLFHPDPYKVAPLKEILSRILGIKVIVDKKREIYFIENVKFHIDSVKGLGSFMEVEAIDIDGTIGTQKLQHQCQYYLDLFKISENDLVPQSYSDLLSKS